MSEFEPTTQDWDALIKSRDTRESRTSTDEAKPVFDPTLAIDLADLKSLVEGDIWLWRGFIARGHITLLSALWKSGKSTLIAHYLISMLLGEPFLGQDTTRCKVLVISEENEVAWIERRDKDGIFSAGDIFIMARPFKSQLSLKEWVTFLEEVATWCTIHDVSLVIFDTLSKFWPVNDENSANDVDKAWLPLGNLTELGIAVLLIHHQRKSGGDNHTASRGSGAISASADVLIDFGRLEGAPSNRRLLQSTSRYRTTPDEIVAEFDELAGEYLILGDKASVSKDENTRRILEMIPKFPEHTTSKIIRDNWFFDAPLPSLRNIQRYLLQLTTDDKVICLDKNQTPNKRYSLPPTEPIFTK